MNRMRDPFRDPLWRIVADYLPAALIGAFLLVIVAPWFPFIGAAVGAAVIVAIVRLINRFSAKRPPDPP